MKQFLFSILITRKFNEKLKFTKDKNFLPLPREWEAILKKNNIDISNFSKIRFNILKIKYVIKGFITLFKALFERNQKKKNLFIYSIRHYNQILNINIIFLFGLKIFKN